MYAMDKKKGMENERLGENNTWCNIDIDEIWSQFAAKESHTEGIGKNCQHSLWDHEQLFICKSSHDPIF